MVLVLIRFKILENRSSNFLEDENIRPFNEINDEIWKIGAEIFIPAAASRLVSKKIDMLID